MNRLALSLLVVALVALSLADAKSSPPLLSAR